VPRVVLVLLRVWAELILPYNLAKFCLFWFWFLDTRIPIVRNKVHFRKEEAFFFEKYLLDDDWLCWDLTQTRLNGYL